MAATRKSATAQSALTTEVEKARPPALAAAGKREIGYSPNYGLFSSSSDLALYPMLQGRSLLQEMNIMSETDDTVGSMMWCIATTLSQVTFKHVPQVDGKDDESSPEAIAAAEFADTLLVDMQEPFTDHIDVALRMVPLGFSLAEIVLKQRTTENSRFNDKMWGIESLPARDPLSILGWKYSPDNRHIVAACQSTWEGSSEIPTWKLLHYRTTASMENPWGRPLFQNAWKAWKYKTKLQDVEAVGAERELVGLPVFGMPQEVLDDASDVDDAGNPTDVAKKAQAMIRSAQDAVSKTRLNKSGGLIIPSDTYAEDTTGDRTPKFSFKLVTTAGQRSIDIRQPIRDYDRAIARVAMMQFLHLGDRSTGSYSLSDDQSSMAVRSMMSLIRKIVAEWNRKALPLVWLANAKDRRYMPRLAGSELSKEGMQAIGAFLAGIAKAEELWKTDPDARIGIAKTANIPYSRQAQIEAAATAKKTADEAAKPQQLALPFGGKGSSSPKDDPADD